MRTNHSSQIPQVVADYFGTDVEHPIIEQEFCPERGWITTGYRKRITVSWATKLRRQGIERVALRAASRLADFSTTEIIRGGVW